MKGHTRWRGTSVEVLVYRGNGKYVSKSVKWLGSKKATQDAADRLLRQLLDELDTTQHDGPESTVDQLVAQWKRLSKHEWSPATLAAYDSYLRNHILPTFGKKKVRNVRPVDIDEFYASLREKGLAQGSIAKAHVILRRAFNEAVRWGWIVSSPVLKAKAPKVARAELSPPSPKEVGKLLDLARKDGPLFTYLTLAADTGARRGELCGLRWAQVDLDGGEIIIDRAIGIIRGGIAEKDTKTHQARRVALGEPAIAVLREHRANCVKRALATGSPLEADAYVFSSHPASDKPWRPDVVTARFGRLRLRACDCKDATGARLDPSLCKVDTHRRMRKVRLHDLRHALVSDWLAAGVDARTVMGRVGHSSLTTLTRYAHFVAAADKEAAQRLGDRHQTG